MLSIHSPDSVFTVLVNIFIHKTHNHFWSVILVYMYSNTTNLYVSEFQFRDKNLVRVTRSFSVFASGPGYNANTL